MKLTPAQKTERVLREQLLQVTRDWREAVEQHGDVLVAAARFRIAGERWVNAERESKGLAVAPRVQKPVDCVRDVVSHDD